MLILAKFYILNMNSSLGANHISKQHQSNEKAVSEHSVCGQETPCLGQVVEALNLFQSQEFVFNHAELSLFWQNNS